MYIVIVFEQIKYFDQESNLFIYLFILLYLSTNIMHDEITLL